VREIGRNSNGRRGNRRGAAMVMVAGAIVLVFAFAILGIDMAILMTTKTQLQNAADAAALAGASGLATGSRNEARTRAKAFASYNFAVRQVRSPVLITDGDVTFPTATSVRVVTHRTRATGDPLRTYFLRVIDLGRTNTTDVRATATAEVADLCSSECIKPWSVPDRWDDANNNDQLDPGEYDPITTGYTAPQDTGEQIVLKLANPQDTIAPGIFFAVDYPPLGQGRPITGADQYREWIATCAPFSIGPGDSLQLEPGRMVGPTVQGVEDLINLDPDAYWDSGEKTVKNSAFGRSPRIVLASFFDPRLPPTSGRNWVRVIKVAAFFIDDVNKNSQVTGYFMMMATPGERCAAGETPGGFLKGLGLVR